MDTRRPVLVTALALTLAACVSRTGTPRPETTAASVAADGTDVSACADGDCEIEVPGPVVIPVPNGTLELAERTEYGIEFDLDLQPRGAVGTLVPGCPLTIYLDPPGIAPDPCPSDERRPVPTPEPGELVVHLVVRDGHQVLRLTSG